MSEIRENVTGNTSIDDGQAWAGNPVDFPPNQLLLGQYIILAMAAVTASLGFICNYFIFLAAWKVPSKSLKSRAFILNSVTGDLILCIGRTVPIIKNITNTFNIGPTFKMISVLGSVVGMATLYSQALVSIPLVLDRVNAVTRPMTYYITGYNGAAMVVMVASPWLVTLALSLPTFILPFVGEQRHSIEPLYVKFDFAFDQFTKPLRDNFLIGVNIFVFLLYVTIFATFIIQRKANRAVENSSRDKAALSLTLTYFFTHLSSLCLYLPAPIYAAIRKSVPALLSSKGSIPFIINRGMDHVYVFNTVVNAFILRKRVPSIRENLAKILKFRFGKTEEDHLKHTQTTRPSTSSKTKTLKIEI